MSPPGKNMASHETASTLSTDWCTTHNTRMVYCMSTRGQQAPMPLSTADDTLNIIQLKNDPSPIKSKQSELILAQCLYKIFQYKQFTIKIHTYTMSSHID